MCKTRKFVIEIHWKQGLLCDKKLVNIFLFMSLNVSKNFLSWVHKGLDRLKTFWQQRHCIHSPDATFENNQSQVIQMMIWWKRRKSLWLDFFLYTLKYDSLKMHFVSATSITEIRLAIQNRYKLRIDTCTGLFNEIDGGKTFAWNSKTSLI